MINKYSILINTCDKFEDCWDPFFKLWTIYWPDSQGRIYLNTEYKDYSYSGLEISSVKGCAKNDFPKLKRATWSQCLKWALDDMDDEIILYMQEDYFLKDTVKNEIVEKYVHLMENHPEIKCIYLKSQAVESSGKSNYEHLDKVKYSQRYRASCQAALWRKDELFSLLREYEDAWEFEEFGSQRSAIMKHEYYVVEREYGKINKFEIVPYVFTGVVQGRWYEEVVPLFKKHDIDVDYSIRGFLAEAPPKPFLKRVEYRLNKIPKIIRNRIDLERLKSHKSKQI